MIVELKNEMNSGKGVEEYGHGGDIYGFEAIRADFSISVNPLGVPSETAGALCRAVSQSFRYPDPACRSLTSKLLAKYPQIAGDVIWGNGASELIDLIVRARLPKTALLLAPTFSEYERCLRLNGCGVHCHVLKRDVSFQPDIKELAEKIGEVRPDIFFVCNPNNPTGTLLTQEKMALLLDACRRAGTLMVADECFGGLLPDPAGASLLPLADLDNPNLIVLRAFTKTYALAGLRLGCAVAGNRTLAERVRALASPWHVSLMAQIAGEAALSEDAYLERARKLIRREVRYIEAELVSCGFYVFHSSANFILFYVPDEKQVRAFYKFCLERGLLIRDLSRMRGLGAGYYRVGVHVHEDNVLLTKAAREYAM